MEKIKTVIITGASQGIGAGLVKNFIDRGYNVVATSRSISQRDTFKPSERLALVDGDIGEEATAKKVTEVAIEKFGAIHALVNNAGMFFVKPFIDYTQEDFKALVSTNLEGYIYITQHVVRQMLKQKSGGSVVGITTSLVSHPIAGMTVSIPMVTKGGIDAISRNLAIEYAKEGIRFNNVAPGIVDTPLHEKNPKDFLLTLSPLGLISDVQDIANAVVYLTEAKTVTGEVLHVDGGAHSGKW
ncbi:MAG: SDR family oxidoreductase [Collimonas sp.]|uniref:SDR family NAD(P)-dependent oxidoreductase n=1 Tax=Collimonas sp. TaxID=1963772 RepID=UPI003267EFFE